MTGPTPKNPPDANSIPYLVQDLVKENDFKKFMELGIDTSEAYN
jgi:hypothetical protein